MHTNTEHLLNAEQVAKLLGKSRRTIDRWTIHRLIPYVRIGARKYYRREAVLRHINKREVQPR